MPILIYKDASKSEIIYSDDHDLWIKKITIGGEKFIIIYYKIL